MAIKIKVYEFENVNDLKEYEQQELINSKQNDFVSETKQEPSQSEKIESEIKESTTEKKTPEKYKAKRNMLRWTEEETKKFANQIIKYRDEGMKLSEAIKLCSEQLGRSIQTLYWKKSELGIMYANINKKTEPKNFEIPNGKNKPYSKIDDEIIIDFATNNKGKGRRISTKNYKKLCKKLNRTKPTLKGRISQLKREGKIEYSNKPALKKPNTIQKESNEDSNRKYMLSTKANIPKKDSFLGNIKTREYLFSNEISKGSEDLLKALIENDLKQRGLCKLSMEKMNLIMNINKSSFEKFTMDVLRLSKNIKNKLGISIVDFRKDIGGDYLVFS